MTGDDFAVMVTGILVVLTGLCLVTGWWESRPARLEFDDRVMCGCGRRHAYAPHAHPRRERQP